MEKHYSKSKPDLRSKNSMIEYLSNHESYYDRHSGRSYSHDIKLYSLGLPKDLEEKAWKFLSLEYSDFWDFYYDEHKRSLIGDTGYSASVTGRSGGHIIFEMERKVDDELEEMPCYELQGYTKTVLRFDQFYEDLKSEFIYYLQTHDFVEEKYTVVKKRMVEVSVEEG